MRRDELGHREIVGRGLMMLTRSAFCGERSAAQTTDEGETKRRESEIDEDGAGKREKKRRKGRGSIGGEYRASSYFRGTRLQRFALVDATTNVPARNGERASFKIITNIEKRRSIFRQRVPIINELQKGETRVQLETRSAEREWKEG